MAAVPMTQNKLELSSQSGKLPFHLGRMLALIRKAIEPYPKAMLYELAAQGRRTPFEQLVACLLSIRTRDEVSGPAARRLLARASSPERMRSFSRADLAELINPCTFSYQKADQLLRICETLIDEFEGQTPCDFENLTSLPGVGPKCANLVLGIACGVPRIGVDIHVHRVTNRWGLVQTPTPEKTLSALEARLPRASWVKLNEFLVPFGKHICLGVRPRCSSCPVLKYCRQVGVTKFS